jgi:hypothetical protein
MGRPSLQLLHLELLVLPLLLVLQRLLLLRTKLSTALQRNLEMMWEEMGKLWSN